MAKPRVLASVRATKNELALFGGNARVAKSRDSQLASLAKNMRPLARCRKARVPLKESLLADNVRMRLIVQRHSPVDPFNTLG